jgi:tetratricopeptide (TPR) repeat protein
LKILFVLEDEISMSNAKIARILRKYPSVISPELRRLLDEKLVNQNDYQEYFITVEGLALIEKQISKKVYYEELREFVRRLKIRPEKGIDYRIVSIIFAFFGIIGLTKSSYAQEVIRLDALAPLDTVAKGTAISKNSLAAITMSIIAVTGGGLYTGDAYYSDPNVEYLVYPAQIPAELHGVSLTVNNVYSTNDKSEITSYECDNKSTIHDLDYSFECITENSLGNKETVTTSVSVMAPNNRLGADATQCVEQYQYKLNENDVAVKYPYLLNLPNISTSGLSNYKDTHVKWMDDFFTERNYTDAKKHATIVLKYFSINDVQALSTLGNIMRDEDRVNVDGVQCAIAVHITPFLYHTPWGKLSLADDRHVSHDFEETVRLASLIIEDYNDPKNLDIHETTYKNALIVKANALFRMAMTEQANDIEDVQKYYTMAHEIEPSYDSWFGLGNLDRYVGDFDKALEKYNQAKKLAIDTTEIDHEISVLLSYI